MFNANCTCPISYMRDLISITYFDKVLSNEDTHVDVARVNLVLVNELNLRVSRLT